ncbi:MAG: exodeoxyribonuclease VII large subunit [Ignavibacteria bacterium]|nr:exodeoxyribonuclease VII large subunit [Ignavibacteria bacterium]
MEGNFLSVSDLTLMIKSVIENKFPEVVFTGEISNFKRHFSSGHLYFTLKDDKSQIPAKMWRTSAMRLPFEPKDGMKVLVSGSLDVYVPHGSYSVTVAEMEHFGLGELLVKLERLKQKLSEEGLFDSERKKPLPDFPRRIGIITSETGAVIQDFKKVAAKRYPVVEILLFHANVQGQGSIDSICKAIAQANKEEYNLDVLVVARGGGSIEDLWTFNEEECVRAIANSRLPIVSAIGHETDTTLADYAADMRAPTPSAAAELILPDKKDLLERLTQYETGIKQNIIGRIQSAKALVESFSRSYILNRTKDIVNDYKIRLDDMSTELLESVKVKFSNTKTTLDNFEKILHTASPEKTLKRGFAIVEKEHKIVSNAKGLLKDDDVIIKFYDDTRKAVIK